MNSLEVQLESLALAILKGFQELERQALDYCRMVAAHLRTYPQLRSVLLNKGFPAARLNSIERAGNGLMDARLLEDGGRAIQHLRRCPLSEQVAALDNRIEVWDAALNDVRLIAVAELSPKQCQQVFAKDRIRTVSEQRTWLNEQVPDAHTLDIEYRVTKDFVIMRDGTRFPRALIKQWSKEMGLL